jgi:antitoxin ParD1/3/4
VRDSLRLMEEREKAREAKLTALRRDIADGLASGPAEPHDMEQVKAEARNRRNASRHGA